MSKKTRNIILTFYVIALVFLVMGASYAYFTIIRVSTISPEVDVTTAIMDFITFDAGRDIFIKPTKKNFRENMGSLSDSTYASAYLHLQEGSKPVTHKYNVYLEIETNNLEYSTPEHAAELIMEVESPDGSVVNHIDGLNYVTVTDGKNVTRSGFDITTITPGKYFIASNYEITTDTEIFQKWNITMTFVNLNASQDANLNKVLKGHISIEKAE